MIDAASPAEALRAAVDAVGGQAAMARLLGLSQPSVFRWLKGAKPLPPEHVLAVEEATGISRHALRPDIYPEGGQREPVVEEDSLFGRFGGPSAMAEALGVAVADVLRWRQERRVPAEHQPAILRRAVSLGLNVVAEDVIWPFPEDRAVL